MTGETMDSYQEETRVFPADPAGLLTPTVVLIDEGLAGKLAPLRRSLTPSAEAAIAAGGFTAKLNGWTAEALAWRSVLATLVAVAEAEGYHLDSSAVYQGEVE